VPAAALDHLFRNGFLDIASPLVATAQHQFLQLTYLDVSFGQLESLSPLRFFPHLDTLVADQNRLQSLHTCPELPVLATLSLNNNEFEGLSELLPDALAKFPTLVGLSHSFFWSQRTVHGTTGSGHTGVCSQFVNDLPPRTLSARSIPHYDAFRVPPSYPRTRIRTHTVLHPRVH
jgi:Leucine-rich repeat (LRR) protein